MKKQTYIIVDAHITRLGAMIAQGDTFEEAEPVAVALRTTNKAEKRYPQIDLTKPIEKLLVNEQTEADDLNKQLYTLHTTPIVDHIGFAKITRMSKRMQIKCILIICDYLPEFQCYRAEYLQCLQMYVVYYVYFF